MIKDGVDESSVEGCADSPYLKSIADKKVDLHSPDLPVPVLWFRSVGHTHTAFVMESLVDELAHKAGKDPLDYRQKLLAGNPRHRAVLNLAAVKAGWKNPLPKGRGRGLAIHESFGSIVAHVAEVSLEGTKIRVHKVTAAVDCGTCVNPEAVRAQIEGAVGFGLTAALFGEITLEGGPGRAVELPRLPDAAPRRDAGGRGLHRPEHRETRRRRRARRASGRPGGRECPVRGHREAAAPHAFRPA